jgi:hypothetical protein
MPKNDGNRTIEDIRIAFRNFAGKEGVYNRAGDKNFAILLEPALAQQLLDDGWNVKFLKDRDDGEDQPYIQVAVSYKTRPPKVAMVTSRGISYLTEDEVELLDWADIEEADCTLHPYEWSVNGKSGVKAYLHTLFVRIAEDYLQDKWTNWVEQNKQLQITPSRRTDYIDGEVVEETYEIEGAT